MDDSVLLTGSCLISNTDLGTESTTENHHLPNTEYLLPPCAFVHSKRVTADRGGRLSLLLEDVCVVADMMCNRCGAVRGETITAVLWTLILPSPSAL